MKPGTAPRLSGHLLDEAKKFLLYPAKIYRSRTNLGAQKFIDDLRRRLLDFRKTFVPQGAAQDEALLSEPFLDEIYSREVLEKVPGMVRRTLVLAKRPASGPTAGQGLEYLREAANCFILGMPQACIALSRAGLESCLKSSLAGTLGKKAVDDMSLKELIDRRRLSPASATLAHRVRTAANDVLHGETGDEAAALACLEDARAVVQHLGRQGP